MRTIHIDEEGTQGQDSQGLRYIVERDIAAEEEHSGARYKVEREHQVALWYDGEWVNCTLYRQDRSGLYLNDGQLGSCDEPPATAGVTGNDAGALAGGGFGLVRPEVLYRNVAQVMPDRLKSPSGKNGLEEILERRGRAIQSLRARLSTITPRGGPEAGDVPALQYPLHRGASWIMRPEKDPFLIVRTVEARENIEVPAGRFAAWRIDHFIDLNGPDDFIKFWYGQPGLVKLTIHFEDIVTDIYGRVTTMTWHEVMELESFVPGGVPDGK
jgi:hypothetical protein